MESEKKKVINGDSDSYSNKQDFKEPITSENDVNSHDEHEEEDIILDNKFPFPPLHGVPTEEQQITFRALFVGCMLGAVVSASNLYLGLKTGWTFGASLFGSILGFAILKPLSKYAPRLLLGGGYFGPKV